MKRQKKSSNPRSNTYHWLLNPKNTYLKILYLALASTLISLGIFFTNPDSLNGKIYNLFTTAKAKITTLDDFNKFLIVEIDNNTYKSLEADKHLSLKHWIKINNFFNNHQAKAYGILQLSNDIFNDPDDELAFILSLGALRKNTTIGLGWNYKHGHIEKLPSLLSSSISNGYERSTYDQKSFGKDNVSRRAYYKMPQSSIFSIQLNNSLFQTTKLTSSYTFKKAKSSQFNINYTNHPKQFKTVSLQKLLLHKEPNSLIKDKIVLLGFNKNYSSDSRVLTPFFNSKGNISISLAQHKAYEILSLAFNKPIRKTPQWFLALLIFCFSFTTLLASFKASPQKAVISILSLLITCFIGSFILFSMGIWIMCFPLILSIISSYYLLLPFRLLKEQRSRWELEKQNSLLREVEELKTNFMSLVSHDLKTPIARIQGITELALNSNNDSNHNPQHFKNIQKSAKELLQFITNILSLSRVEDKSLKLQETPTDINTLIESILTSLDPQIKAKQINLQKDLYPLYPINCDPILIRQAIHNVIENAIKYSPMNSSISINTSEKESLDPKNPWSLIQIKDNGPGLNNKEQQRVFEKFYRGHQPNTIKSKGSGLGLYLVKYFIELHGGQLKLHSISGKGSTFSILLPAQNPKHTLKNKKPLSFSKKIMSTISKILNRKKSTKGEQQYA